nr:zinc ribbon domain-containing protein [Candidatus Freyarchaeota archaeon]
MANSLLIVFSIVLDALGIFAILFAFAYQNIAMLGVAFAVFVISVIILVWAFKEETPKKEAPSAPTRVETPVKMKPKVSTIPAKSTKPKPVKPTKTTVLPPNTVYCTYCGKQIPKDILFCPNCGSSME